MGSLRVVVAGFDSIYRAGLCAVLPSFEPMGRVAVVGQAGELSRSASLVRLLRPDVVITDLSFQEGPAESVDRLLAEHPDTRLLVIGEQAQLRSSLSWFEERVSGFVVRPEGDTDLLEAMETIVGGGRFVDERLKPQPEQQAGRLRRALTDREAQILRLLAFGYTNAEIAAHLVISVRTAESHRSHIQRKLGVRTRAGR